MKLWFFTSISVLLNAFLVQQLLYSSSHEDSSNSTCFSSQITKDERIRVFSSLTADEIIRMGKVFFYSYASLLLLEEYDSMNLGLEMGEDVTGEPLSGAVVDLMSVPVSDIERKEKKLKPKTVVSLLDRFENHGVFVLQELFERERCRSIAQEGYEEIMNPTSPFSTIRHDDFRKDYRLKMEGSIYDILRDAVELLEPFINAALGPDSILTEFSALYTFPKATTAQAFHTDSSISGSENYNNSAKCFSLFIYLDDIVSDGGPLEFIPGSHSHAHYLEDDDNEVARQAPYVRLTVPQGSIVLYNSQVLHRGGANTSPFARPSVLVTFQESGKHGPLVKANTLRDFYRTDRGVVSLNDFIHNRIPEYEPTFAQRMHDDEICLQQVKSLCPDSKYDGDRIEQYACAYYFFTGDYLDDEYEHEYGEIEWNYDIPEIKKAIELSKLSKKERRARAREDHKKMPVDEYGRLTNPREAVLHLMQEEVNGNPMAFDKRLDKCGIISRIQMMLEVWIFDDQHKARVSWGTLKKPKKRDYKP